MNNLWDSWRIRKNLKGIQAPNLTNPSISEGLQPRHISMAKSRWLHACSEPARQKHGLVRELGNQVWHQAWAATSRFPAEHGLDSARCEYVCASFGSLLALCLFCAFTFHSNVLKFLCALMQHFKEDNNTALHGWAVVCRRTLILGSRDTFH